MNNQTKKLNMLLVKKLALLLSAVFFAWLFLAFVLIGIARAGTSVYVRPGGSDSHCNGLVNQDYFPDVAPNCAVKTVEHARRLAGFVGGTVVVVDGESSATISTNDEIDAASTTLAISKRDSSDPVDAGTPFTYTIIVTNTGATSATNVRVLDTLPAENVLNYVDGTATASQGTAGCSVIASAPPVISCTLGVLNSGVSATVTIPVTPTAAGPVKNSASVSSPEANTQSIEEFTTFAGETNLSISKSDTPDPVPVGQPLTYTITITNSGPVGVIAITLTDNLPNNVFFISTIPGPSACNHVSGSITCTLGFLDVNDSTLVQIVVTPTVDGLITNTATVTGSGADSDFSNNVATQTTTVLPAADLSITKSDSPDPVNPGDTLTYTLTIINNGLSDAQNVVVTDTLPLSVSVVSVNPVTNTQSGQQLSWNLGTITNGASRTITVVVTVDSNASGSITNTAVVSSTTLDLVPGNNTATATTTIGGGGPSAVYLPIIFKNFKGAFAALEWDGLEPVRDRVSDLDDGAGLATDGNNDGVFKLFLDVGSEGPKTVSTVELSSTQGFEWDTTTPDANPVLGIFNGDTALNDSNGTISDTVVDPGLITLHLYASDDTSGTPTPRFPADTYTYTVTINFTDGTVLTAQARIPPAGSGTPSTSLPYVSDVAADPATNQIFVASPRHNWVYVIDGSTDTITRNVSVGNGPTGLTVLTATVAANNKVFVAHQYGANYWRPGVKAFGVYDSSSHNTANDGYVGSAPIKIAANSTNSNRVYVSNYFDKLAVLNGASGPPESYLGSVIQKAYQGAYGIDTSSATNRVYLATRDTGELVVFDGNSDRLLQSDYIPTHVKPPQACSLWSVAVNETTGHVFVPCPQLGKVFVLQENQISVLDLESLGVLEEREGNLALVVSPAAAPWIAEISVQNGTDLGEEGIAVDTSTGLVFITNAGNDSVVVLQDGSTPDYVTTVSVGTNPQGIDVNPVTQKVYVGNSGSNDVTVLSATSPFTTLTTISLTP